MKKYIRGSDGYYEGAVLKPGEKGIIQYVMYKPSGEWVTYSTNGELKTFPLWNHFTDKNKRSLGQLAENEFNELVQKLSFLPKEEMVECYELLKGVYNARQTRNRA